jgi:nucleotide-binding universal stress UspA family protein/CBS domain-containing protein
MRSPVTTVDEQAPLERARALLAAEGAGWLPVVGAAGPVGMLGPAEVRRGAVSSVPVLARFECASLVGRVRVGQIMRRGCVALSPEATVQEAAGLMATQRVECVFVVDGGEILGVVTAQDLLGVIVTELERGRPPRFARIVAAVDFTAPSLAALGHAVALARRDGASLTLVHVLPAPARRRATEGVAPTALARLAETRRRDAVERLHALVPAGEGLALTERAAFGDPAAEIAETAARQGADLIVLGAGRRRGRVARLFSPGVAERLVRLAPCPVLALGRGWDGDAGR